MIYISCNKEFDPIAGQVPYNKCKVCIEALNNRINLDRLTQSSITHIDWQPDSFQRFCPDE